MTATLEVLVYGFVFQAISKEYELIVLRIAFLDFEFKLLAVPAACKHVFLIKIDLNIRLQLGLLLLLHLSVDVLHPLFVLLLDDVVELVLAVSVRLRHQRNSHFFGFFYDFYSLVQRVDYLS